MKIAKENGVEQSKGPGPAVRNNERSEPFRVANDWNWLEITERKNNEGGGEGIRKRSERSGQCRDFALVIVLPIVLRRRMAE